MGYGGTNWGTLGDPDVYTSYDYSACIREFMYLSGRGRKLRLGLAFTRSFNLLTRTDRIPPKAQTIKVTPPKFLNNQRVSAGDKVAELAFIRNFSREKTTKYTVTLIKRPAVKLKGILEYKRSFIALGAYSSDTSGVHLLFSTAPIHLRTHILVEGRRTEVWIVQNDSKAGGELAFQGEVWVTRGRGELGASVNVVKEASASIISFKGTYGWCGVSSMSAKENTGMRCSSRYSVLMFLPPDHRPSELLILALPEEELYKLSPTFEEGFWADKGRIGDMIRACGSDPVSVSWGSYFAQHDIKRGTFEVEWQDGEDCVFALFSAGLASRQHFGFKPFTIEADAGRGHPLAGFPGLEFKERHSTDAPLSTLQNHSMGQFHSWSARSVDFDSYSWIPLAMSTKKATVPALDTIDLGYTSGHVLYKISVPATEYMPVEARNLVLSLDTRHRCIIYLNKEYVVGGHTSYALQLFSHGAKQGPDPFQDLQRYIIPHEKLRRSGVNTLYILVESWGLNRQAFALNDVRNARGIRHLKVESEPVGGTYAGFLFNRRVKFGLEVTGVDARELHQPFNHCGLPDEEFGAGYLPLIGSEIVPASGAHDGVAVLTLGPEKQPRWFQGAIKLSLPHGVRVPLRLHLSGPATAHVWIQNTYLAKYYGNGDCVQKDFIIPETYLAEKELSVKVLVYDGRRLQSGEVADWVGLSVKGWNIENGEGQAKWSGNLWDGETGSGVLFATTQESWR
ncbi:hypothetical protein HDU99_001096 [Rhizoclosmatium hyalinum]|nr:hypothetical protein HDU99_001096 [Rhizoclosmatium hyalinum]